MSSRDWNVIVERVKKGFWSPFLTKIFSPIFTRLPNRGIKVVDEDWDYLIVLDACRYDTFKEVNWLEGDLRKVRSRGSTSSEWLRNNFTGYYEDIVYISANAHVSPTDHGDFRSDEHFPQVFPVFMNPKYEEDEAVAPESVTSKVLDIKEDFNDERMIIHYMQPHNPFIGDEKLEEGNYRIEELLDNHEIADIKKAYRSNLERVLSELEDNLLPYLEGKIVITADHGQAFGEKGFYEHPPGIHISELVEVPWFVMEKDDSLENEEISGVDV